MNEYHRPRTVTYLLQNRLPPHLTKNRKKINFLLIANVHLTVKLQSWSYM